LSGGTKALIGHSKVTAMTNGDDVRQAYIEVYLTLMKTYPKMERTQIRRLAEATAREIIHEGNVLRESVDNNE